MCIRDRARVEKYGIALGKDFQKINDSIRDRVAALEKNRNRTMQDMSDIWNDLCEVKNDEDIIALLENIDSVLQKGIPSTDQVDFEELKDNLHKLLEDINTIKRTIQSRAQYEEISKSMLEKYEKSELEFDVIPILKDILTSICLLYTSRCV